ncbi:MAG: thioredoxin family protein [Longicatena sp.]
MKLFNKKVESKACCCNGNCDFEQEGKSVTQEGVFVLGSGCAKCNALEKSVQEAIQEMGLSIPIQHITDFAEIARYGVMTTPALVLNKKVVSYGKVLTKEEAKELLKKAGY